jgi:hypothetical protein
MSKRQRGFTFVFFLALLLVVLAAFSRQPAPLQAQGAPLPTATPWGVPPPPTRMYIYQQPPGGTLILYVPEASAHLWTVVQWEDTNGDWHDVEGWRSQLTDGFVGWWVDPADFSTGPFRWAVLDGPDGELLHTSESFYLPAFVDGVVYIEITGALAE